MFCKNCGKELADGERFCPGCGTSVAAPAASFNKAHEHPAQPAGQFAPQYSFRTPEAPSVAKENKSNGFGGALTATILGSIALIFGILVMVFANEADMYSSRSYYGYSYYFSYTYYSYDEEVLVYGLLSLLLFTPFALGLSIPSLIMGIKSIKNFGAGKKEDGTRSVATLVLGIAGLVLAATVLLLVFIAFFVTMGAFASL